jgi:TfoX/Sxy family transcriptional regulator of competence genes
VYVDGKVVALICDDQLVLKPTLEGQRFLGKVTEAPPYPGAKNYYLLASELDDPERLGAALQVTADALPKSKPRGVNSRAVRAKKAKANRAKE